MTTGMQSKTFLRLPVKSKTMGSTFNGPRQWALRTISCLSSVVTRKMDLSIKLTLRTWEMGPFRRKMSKTKLAWSNRILNSKSRIGAIFWEISFRMKWHFPTDSTKLLKTQAFRIPKMQKRNPLNQFWIRTFISWLSSKGIKGTQTCCWWRIPGWPRAKKICLTDPKSLSKTFQTLSMMSTLNQI